MGRSIAEVLLGEQQQGFAVHLERATGDRPQGELLLSPPQPLGHVVPAPEDWLQTCRWGGGGDDGGKGVETRVWVKKQQGRGDGGKEGRKEKKDELSGEGCRRTGVGVWGGGERKKRRKGRKGGRVKGREERGKGEGERKEGGRGSKKDIEEVEIKAKRRE